MNDHLILMNPKWSAFFLFLVERDRHFHVVSCRVVSCQFCVWGGGERIGNTLFSNVVFCLRERREKRKEKDVPYSYSFLILWVFVKKKTDRTDCVRPSHNRYVHVRTARQAQKKSPPSWTTLLSIDTEKTVRAWYHTYYPFRVDWLKCGSFVGAGASYPPSSFCGSTTFVLCCAVLLCFCGCPIPAVDRQESSRKKEWYHAFIVGRTLPSEVDHY